MKRSAQYILVTLLLLFIFARPVSARTNNYLYSRSYFLNFEALIRQIHEELRRILIRIKVPDEVLIPRPTLTPTISISPTATLIPTETLSPTPTIELTATPTVTIPA